IGDEPIVPDRELVELPAARRVLILETVRLTRPRRSRYREDERVVDRGQHVPSAREEAADRSKPVLDASGARRRERERAPGAARQVDALRPCPRAAQGPDLVD